LNLSQTPFLSQANIYNTMASLSSLNKKERKIRADVSKLRSQLRKKDITKREFDKSFEKLSLGLEKIAEQKSKLIGLPPMPPPPKGHFSPIPEPPRKEHDSEPTAVKKNPPDEMPKPPKQDDGFGLDSIKRTILGSNSHDSSKEKPKADALPPPPKTLKSISKSSKKDDTVKLLVESDKAPKAKSVPNKPVAKKSASKKPKPTPKLEVPKPPVPTTEHTVVKETIREVPVIKERIREVPVIKERIREVPVIKEVIKEVRVPVIKEKRVPVIKTIKVPTDDPALAKKVAEALNAISEVNADVAIREKELQLLNKEIIDIRSRISSAEEMKIDVKALTMRIDKMDFTALSSDIYKQFNAIKESLEERSSSKGIDSEIAGKVSRNTEDLRDLQSDFTRVEKETSEFLKEVREAINVAQNIQELKPKIDSLMTKTSNIDFEGLTREIYNQFEKMNSSIKDQEKKTDDLVEKMNVEMKTLKEMMGDSHVAKEHVENLDITSIRRDMEALKQKSQYIEQHIERVDVEPLVRMIQDVENKVESLKASSALIIE